MSNRDDLPPHLRPPEVPRAVEELPLQEMPDIPPPPPATESQPEPQHVPDPYLRRG